jgi:diguanylate cyclase (GGDEF)-like protein
MKFEFNPELFDGFFESICIVNSDLVAVYVNPCFLDLLSFKNLSEVYKEKIPSFLNLIDFNWDQIRFQAKPETESITLKVRYKSNNVVGDAHIFWRQIKDNNGQDFIALSLKKVSNEAELIKLHHEEMNMKNMHIATLDEHIFQISIVKNILEKSTSSDDPLVMLRNVFSDLSQIFQIDYILYLQEEEENSAPILKTCGGPGRTDLRIARAHADKIVPELIMAKLSNTVLNDLYWISFETKDDLDLRRYFIFGKSQKFTAKDENLLGMLCEPLSLSLNNRELLKKAITDQMTDLYNHRYFKLRLDKEILAHENVNKKMGLLIIDVDYFKKVNDTYGHLIGDIVLTHVAHTLKKQFRVTDVPARYGGEEFAIILREVDESQVLTLAERLRQSIEAMEVVAPGLEKPLKITASIGVSVYPSHAKLPLDLIALADQCLYDAKRSGRNRCVMSSVPAITNKNAV